MKLRHELKHYINYSDMLLIQKSLSKIARYDEHADEDGNYIVKSLYFDNYMDKALKEKYDGLNKREKFRMRFYGNDTSFIRLEKKSKISGLCSKEVGIITPEQCQKIINGDIQFLLDSEIPLLREFYAKMRYQLLRPKYVVAYNRQCFVYPPGNVRITLDTQICGSHNVSDFLNPDLPLIPLDNTIILEVKWDEYLPKIISDAILVKSRRMTAFSKYAATRHN